MTKNILRNKTWRNHICIKKHYRNSCMNSSEKHNELFTHNLLMTLQRFTISNTPHLWPSKLVNAQMKSSPYLYTYWKAAFIKALWEHVIIHSLTIASRGTQWVDSKFHWSETFVMTARTFCWIGNQLDESPVL